MALWGSCWGWFARAFVGLALVEVLGHGRGRHGAWVVGPGDDRARAAERSGRLAELAVLRREAGGDQPLDRGAAVAAEPLINECLESHRGDRAPPLRREVRGAGAAAQAGGFRAGHGAPRPFLRRVRCRGRSK
jgi:hypothetical protein